VARRLRDVLHDLLEVAPPDRRPVLDAELDLLDAAVQDRYGDPRDVSLALTADRQGLGIGDPQVTGSE
jgi:hypothetical protein